MSLRRVLHRVRQFCNLALVPLNEDERKEIDTRLTPTQRKLFYGMSRLGQRHCLNVYRALRRACCRDVDTLCAALLHDVGKEGVGITHRVVCVLLQGLSPSLLERLASDRQGFWRYGLYLNLNHAQQGAEMAEAAGASPLTVDLIRFHQSRGGSDPRLVALKQADEMN
ncbi:MAG: HD domain-containing protein [Chloroflexota bacterium]